MVNEFLPSRAPGQLRRRVEEGPENEGMTGRPRRWVGRYARKIREAVEKGVVSCCTTFNPCTAKLRINTKAMRHVKVVKSHREGGRQSEQIRDGQIRETLSETFIISHSHLRSNSRPVEIGRTDLLR